MSDGGGLGDAVRQTVLIANKRGLHARASAKFVTLAAAQDATIEVEKAGSGSVAGTSIMGLMMLGAAKGDHVTISAAGPKADAALAVLVELVENKFGEE